MGKFDNIITPDSTTWISHYRNDRNWGPTSHDVAVIHRCVRYIVYLYANMYIYIYACIYIYICTYNCIKLRNYKKLVKSNCMFWGWYVQKVAKPIVFAPKYPSPREQSYRFQSHSRQRGHVANGALRAFDHSGTTVFDDHLKVVFHQLMVNCWFGARWFGILHPRIPIPFIFGDSRNPFTTGTQTVPKPTINHKLMKIH